MKHVSSSAYVAAFTARIQKLRDDKGWTQQQMAVALGVPLGTYKKYESRTLLPHILLERFSLIVDRDIGFLVTGKAPKRRPYDAGADLP
jgi:transcriptional regulator with XRE-family HTH domain